MTPNRISTRRSPVIATAVAVVLGAPVASVAAAGTESVGALEEIVVTANRREQTVLDVPYNISAVTGASLQSAGVTNLNDLSRLVPGITIPDLGPRANSSNSLIIIRGMNVNDPVNSAYLPWGSVPTVSTYVDDVPQFVNLALSDVARIEVLRGPQGTLYGSGAVGGTVKIVHNAPDPSAFDANVSVEGSETQHAGSPSSTLEAMLNIPVSPDFALRLSAGYNRISGFINAKNAVRFDGNMQPVLADPSNPLTSGFVTGPVAHVDDAHGFHARLAARWKANDWLTVDATYHRQDDHSNGFSHQTAGENYETDMLVPYEPEHRTVDLESLTLTADAGFATVTTSTSYSTVNVANIYDESQFVIAYDMISPFLYGNYPRITSLFYTTSKDTNFTQEFRLVSKTGGDWDYTAGLFFQHQTQNLFQYETIPGFAAWSELPGSADAIATNPVYANFGDFVQYYNGGTRPSALTPRDTNFTYLRISGFLDRAAYGELTRHITDKWQVTAGGRIFWQDFSQGLDSTIPFGGPLYSTLPAPANATDQYGTTLVQRQQSFHNHIFKLNTSYALDQHSRVYATYSEGFRHGGINALPLGACIFCESPNIVPYRPDTVKNYEVGFKGEKDGWLRYSLAAYRVDWKDVQIQVFGQAGDPAVVNGRDAVSQGLEAELTGQLSDHWAATVGYGYTDAKITQGFTVTDPVNGTVYTLVSANAGDRLPYVPKQTLTGDLAYSTQLSDQKGLEAHLDASYRSDVTTQLNSTALGYQHLGGFTTVSASVAMTFGDAWQVRLFGENLTNVMGITSAGSLLRIYDDPRYRIQNPTRPRTIGVGVNYKFR
jgi:iron complex outermembrane recepter protein